MPERGVDVFVEIGGQALLAGQLWSHRRGSVESATFRYAPDYIAYEDSYALDPTLPLREGPFHTSNGRELFSAFTDSAPDRWGRRLIDRDERHRIEQEGGAARSFGQIDYLLHARDDMRQGALRFRDPETGAFLADRHDGVPYFLQLSELLTAAEHLERNQASIEEVRVLLRGGSSLGGARPKAHVRHQNGEVGIAKFPSPANDAWDVIRWEAVALELARRSGITVPGFEVRVLDRKPVLIVDRFDRYGELRIGYVSAMTLLEARDGDQRSYIEIAEVIEDDSAEPTADLQELWRRIAFSILISNTDDHLRNHGFLRTSTAGWSLSPAFDLNPDPRPGIKYLSTAIEPGVTIAAIKPLMDVAPYFRLDEDQAQGVLSKVASATSQWREVAEQFELSKDAIAEMALAFEHEQAAIAASALTT
ncbi:MAG: type II toxin-antitoxin system HipA family toxin [Actinomycetota bacterium]|nr:type II toxin-antitoxin system HipA family toxin [Actinomycetota bacterium]